MNHTAHVSSICFLLMLGLLLMALTTTDVMNRSLLAAAALIFGAINARTLTGLAKNNDEKNK